MTTALYLLGAILLILVNAFFVAVEFSLITVSQSFLKEKSEAGDRSSVYAIRGTQKLTRYLAGSQLGITSSTLALGFLAEPAVARLFDLAPLISHAVAAALALTFVTFVQMVIGEIVPKNLALADPDRTALLLARPHSIFVTLLSPVIWVLDKMTSFIVRLLGVEPDSEETAARTPVELVGAVKESLGVGVIDKFDHDLLTGALDLAEETVGQKMVMRARIVYAEPNATAREIEQKVLDSGHSRIPVIDRAMKNVMGFIHIKDLFDIPIEKIDEEIDSSLIRPVLNLAPECSLDEALVSMQTQRLHLAIIADRRNNILGLITIEDVLESLVGEFPED